MNSLVRQRRESLTCFDFNKNNELDSNDTGPVERFLYDLEMKTCEQNRNNKRTEIQKYKYRFDWFVEWIQMRVAYGWLKNAQQKKLHARELSRSQSILHFYVTLQHNFGQSNSAFSNFYQGFLRWKTKSPCFDLFIHWLIKQINKEHLPKPFFKSYENHSYLKFST